VYGMSENTEEYLRRRLERIIRQCGAGLPVDISVVEERATRACLDASCLNTGIEEAIRTAASLVVEEPEYSDLAAALLSASIGVEIDREGTGDLLSYIDKGAVHGLLGERQLAFLRENAGTLSELARRPLAWPSDYAGLKLLFDRYLLRSPDTGHVIESPAFFLIRAVTGLCNTMEEADELHVAFSSGAYLTSGMFYAGTPLNQLCSCFVLGPPEDSLTGILDLHADMARISKVSGGVGLAYHSVRARGSTIRSTNGKSKGVVPWLHILDATVDAVNQGGRRAGAACVFLETWHADIEDFLALRSATGAVDHRTHNLQFANWIPDLFMERVEADGSWSLFDPADVPELVGRWGDAFGDAYRRAEAQGLAKRTVEARSLYAKMLRLLGETGTGWFTFKDACNRKGNQTAVPGNVIQLSNLCTEIAEVTERDQHAVCTLGSINLKAHCNENGIDYGKLARTVAIAVCQLDRVVDINTYPLDRARASNLAWRPIGLGVMGLQDVFFMLRLPFDVPGAADLSAKISEYIYYHALKASCELSKAFGPHPRYRETRAFVEQTLQHDLWQVEGSQDLDWPVLRRDIAKHGLRNSLLVAIAPTVTISSLVGCYESIEPQYGNLYRKETSSGDFVCVNRYLVDDLRKAGLWNKATRDAIQRHRGSIQDVPCVPEAIRRLYKTVWDIPQKVLIDMATRRGAFVDQSQSLNLYLSDPSLDRLSSMYMHAWKAGLKTTYYLRSRSATSIARPAEGATACEVCQ